MEVKVYGCSDDIISVDGAICDEFAYNDEPVFLAFSEGTVLVIEYGDSGLWRVTRVHEGDAVIEKFEATDPSSKAYTDVVTLRGKIEWVVVGKMAAKAK